MFPSNMKTGFSLNEAPTLDLVHLHNLLIKFAKKSVLFAAHYSTHAGRTNLSGTDELYALQYLCHEFFNVCNLNESVSDSDSGEEDSDSGEEDSDSGEADDDLFTRANDDDDVCAKMNMYHDTWNSWEPTDEIEIILKRNVDKTKNIYLL